VKGFNLSPSTTCHWSRDPHRSGRESDRRGERQILPEADDFDALLIAGQAKSHCVGWTVDDLLADCRACGPELGREGLPAGGLHLPVVVPGAIDYTDEADAAFQRFAEAGVHLVRSADPIAAWPGMPLPSPAK
jgi:hypothetical protein